MLDPMKTLIVAKAKAVGLVAGTALLTTALVGGGAVAMTAVSSEGEVETAVVEPLDLEAADTVSDTPTVVIDDDEAEEAPETEEVEDGEDGEGKVRPPLPAGFVCDDSKNHGQNVSAYAKSLPKGPGRGALVSAVAQSDCGKKAGDDAADDVAEEESVETESAEPEAAETETEVEDDEPKPDKAAKAEKKTAKKSAKAKKSGKK